MKKTFLAVFLLAVLFGLFGASFIFAQEEEGRELEIKYPKFLDYQITGTTTTLPNYVKYIFYFALGISGVIALFVIIQAGVQYLISAGNPAQLKEAKDKIFSALLGLLILFCSVLFIKWINPQIINLQIKPADITPINISPGVWLCTKELDWEFNRGWNLIELLFIKNKEVSQTDEIRKQRYNELVEIMDNIKKSCHNINVTEKIQEKDIVAWLYFVPERTDSEGIVDPAEPWKEKQHYKEYGAILQKEIAGEVFAELTEVAYRFLKGKPGEPFSYGQISLLDPTIIIPFRINYAPNPGWGAILYQGVNYNRDWINAENSPCYLTGYEGVTDTTAYCEFSFDDPSIETPGNKVGAESIKIEGNLVAILCKESFAGAEPSPANCVVLTNSESNLLQFEIISDFFPCWQWEEDEYGGGYFLMPSCRVAVSKAIRIIAIDFLFY